MRLFQLSGVAKFHEPPMGLAGSFGGEASVIRPHNEGVQLPPNQHIRSTRTLLRDMVIVLNLI